VDALVQNAIDVMGPLRWVFCAVLLAITVISWAAGAGHIGPNGSVGIRVPALQRSDAAWRSGHAAAVRPAAIALLVCLVSAVASVFIAAFLWGVLIALVGGMVYSIASAVRAANAA
jgi:hypothetical protein